MTSTWYDVLGLLRTGLPIGQHLTTTLPSMLLFTICFVEDCLSQIPKSSETVLNW